MPVVAIEVAAKSFALPNECPCCGAVPDTDLRITAHGMIHVGGAPHALEFPYCERCVAHVRLWEASGVLPAGIAVLAIIVAVVLAVTWSVIPAIAIFAIVASLAWWLRRSRKHAASAACGPSCSAVGRAVQYLGWDSATRKFSFTSPTFAARFAEANTATLANVSDQLRKLLDGYKRARLAVPTPAAAAVAVPPPLTAREWATRIERTKGVVARRIALTHALEMIEEPQPRRELIQTVAQIELAPLLDKLQRLSSPTTKRTLLQNAIEKLRADNIPAELQAAELEKLEARLAELH